MDSGMTGEGINLLDEARAWIQGTIEGGAASISTDAELLEGLRRSLEIERATETFYRQHATHSDDDSVRDLFSALAELEKTHYLLVSSWIEFFNRPSEWVESAEFGQRAEY